MERSEIRDLLERWCMNGELVSKVGSGLNYAAVNRAIAKQELYATSFSNVVARSKKVRDELEKLIHEGRIMNTSMAKARTGYLTSYKISLACAEGELLRFSMLGNGSVLFIK